MMFPIGVVTRNRVECLDATLRSLSATALPDDVVTTVVHDGAGDDPRMHRYLTTDEPIPRVEDWIEFPGELGLDVLDDSPMTGIVGRVELIQLDERRGVANASNAALVHMLDAYPDAERIALLQDDVVLNVDWLGRVLRGFDERLASDKEPGLVSGLRINDIDKSPIAEVTSEWFSSAQVLVFSRRCLKSLDKELRQEYGFKNGWDTWTCYRVRDRGFTVHLVHPSVGQHIGVKSIVRPNVRWEHKDPRGRISYEARPPYAMATTVRNMSLRAGG